ncbi:hypothetical protein HY086_00550 [Candidatus Gottesmanbacteria bacterium]|nr:hypothetical protein [Candidatus Gottesmanbacteria bacterium]
MRIKPLIGSVVAPTDERHWGQVLILPSAYGVVEIFDETGQAQDRGLRLLSRLSERLTNPIVSLAAARAVAKEVADTTVVSLVLLIPVGMTVYLILVGEGSVYLKRGGQLAELLDSAGSLSGQLAVGDTVLIGTKQFIDVIGSDDLAHSFDHFDVPNIAERLTMRLSEKVGAFGGAGLVFGVGETIPVEEEGIPEEPIDSLEAPVVPPVRLRNRFTMYQIKRTVHQRLPLAVHLWHRGRERFAGKNGALLTVAIVCCLLFFGSVMLGIRKQFTQGVDVHVASAILEAQHAYDEGVALLDLNPVKGRERLTGAKLILDALAATVSAKTKTGRQIATLGKEVNDRLTLAMQVYRGEPELFYDAGLIKKGATISSFALEGDQLVLVDSGGKTVLLLALSSKNGQIIAGGESFSGARLIAIHGEKVYVFVADGIHLIRTEDKKTEPLIIKKDNQWGNIASLVAFGGNMYLLDTAKSRIWKYVATDKGFSERHEYLNPDTLPDFTWTNSMAIDGSVWLGTTEGKILRFTQGQENTFLPKGVAPPFGKDLTVYTSDEVKHVYVLDRENKRVVMLEKDGIYLSQYAWDGGTKPTQLVVSESLKKILLLADGKIYALELK